MDVQQYLTRINYAGPTDASLPVLTALHRAHLQNIPYENLDIHLGRKLEISVQNFFNKIVLQKRGGWCFEMNGLLAWVLQDLGFDVQLLAGSVEREDLNAAEAGDHLVLLVNVQGKKYLTDVGFGDGFLEPIPLLAGEHVCNGFLFRLEEPSPGRWVLHNHKFGAATQFDFSLQARELKDFNQRCDWLQTSAESGFVRTTVCQRFTETNLFTLRGAVLTTVTPTEKTTRTINNQAEYVRVLEQEFLLEHPELAALWEKVWQRHQEFTKEPTA